MRLKDKSKNTSGMSIYEWIIKFIEAKIYRAFLLKWIQYSTRKEQKLIFLIYTDGY